MMIKLSISEIESIIRPYGLSPMKSKGIFGLSNIIIEKHSGKVPDSFDDLEKLPSVGQKTECCNVAGLWISCISSRYSYP